VYPEAIYEPDQKERAGFLSEFLELCLALNLFISQVCDSFLQEKTFHLSQETAEI
jgi:hypothetical protein